MSKVKQTLKVTFFNRRYFYHLPENLTAVTFPN